ncbi:uncharacterized protein PRCAT00002550001 [Priceomyces carsonii]|uniref:uncharacterized protein n=1 Tax=Priceomyces carsonii TaxID=28549 RepID=UPI002ED7BE54|nr:unnamed protein product [Priceomyces carsonii]
MRQFARDLMMTTHKTVKNTVCRLRNVSEMLSAISAIRVYLALIQPCVSPNLTHTHSGIFNIHIRANHESLDRKLSLESCTGNYSATCLCKKHIRLLHTRPGLIYRDDQVL